MSKLTIKQPHKFATTAQTTTPTLRILSTSELITAFQNLLDSRPFTDTSAKVKNLQVLAPSVAMQPTAVRRAVARAKDVLKTFSTAQATGSALFTEQDAKTLRSEYRTAVKDAIGQLRLVPASPEAGLAVASFTIDQIKSKANNIIMQTEADPEFKNFKIITDLPIVMTNLYGEKLAEIQKYFRTYDYHNTGYTVVGGQALFAYRNDTQLSADQKLKMARHTLELINDKHGTGYAIVGDTFIKVMQQGTKIIYFWIMRETIMTRLVGKHVFTDQTDWTVLSEKFEQPKKGAADSSPGGELLLSMLGERVGTPPKLSLEASEVLYGLLHKQISTTMAAPSLEAMVTNINRQRAFRQFKTTLSDKRLLALLSGNYPPNDHRGKMAADFLAAYQNKYHVETIRRQ